MSDRSQTRNCQIARHSVPNGPPRYIENLTPGDFSVVARQLRHVPASGADELVGRLALEAAAKPGGMSRIGF